MNYGEIRNDETIGLPILNRVALQTLPHVAETQHTDHMTSIDYRYLISELLPACKTCVSPGVNLAKLHKQTEKSIQPNVLHSTHMSTYTPTKIACRDTAPLVRLNDRSEPNGARRPAAPPPSPALTFTQHFRSRRREETGYAELGDGRPSLGETAYTLHI
jgi:hypothetical protein